MQYCPLSTTHPFPSIPTSFFHCNLLSQQNIIFVFGEKYGALSGEHNASIPTFVFFVFIFVSAEKERVLSTERLSSQRGGGATDRPLGRVRVSVVGAGTAQRRAFVFCRCCGHRVRRELGGPDHCQVLGERSVGGGTFSSPPLDPPPPSRHHPASTLTTSPIFPVLQTCPTLRLFRPVPPDVFGILRLLQERGPRYGRGGVPLSPT